MAKVKVKSVTVTVTYQVELSELEMDEEVYNQILEANEKGISLDIHNTEYPKASDWLCDNIEERDAYEWQIEVDDIVESENK